MYKYCCVAFQINLRILVNTHKSFLNFGPFFHSNSRHYFTIKSTLKQTKKVRNARLLSNDLSEVKCIVGYESSVADCTFWQICKHAFRVVCYIVHIVSNINNLNESFGSFPESFACLRMRCNYDLRSLSGVFCQALRFLHIDDQCV